MPYSNNQNHKTVVFNPGDNAVVIDTVAPAPAPGEKESTRLGPVVWINPGIVHAFGHCLRLRRGLQGFQEIRRPLRVRRSRKDRPLVVFEDLEPAFDIGGVILPDFWG